jgi:hypothetical protein
MNKIFTINKKKKRKEVKRNILGIIFALLIIEVELREIFGKNPFGNEFFHGVFLDNCSLFFQNYNEVEFYSSFCKHVIFVERKKCFFFFV